jgi:formiminotetrahydrofolate cyclodeaminase
LVALVARLSLGKEGMEPESFYQEVIVEADELSRLLFAGGYEDEMAFVGIREGYQLPKDTAEQRSQRVAAIQQATIQAARVPLRNAERCSRVVELCKQLRGCSNPNAASDLECAEYLAVAGIKGCVANVLTNVSAIKDSTISAELAAKAEALRPPAN